MKRHLLFFILLVFAAGTGRAAELPDRLPRTDREWTTFLGRHDLCWDTLTADPVQPAFDNRLTTGYYAGVIMGNGLLGTNLYKLRDGVYRLNMGRSDVTEARQPYNLYNSARLPIGYFTLATKGKVKDERLRLSLYDATALGRIVTDEGEIRLRTYVHAAADYVVFETETSGGEADFSWDFVAQQAVSPRQVFNHDAPAGYVDALGRSNPEPERLSREGCEISVQRLTTDTTFRTTARAYAVAWREERHGQRRRIVATVTQAPTAEEAAEQAVRTLRRAARTPARRAWRAHRDWWHAYYRRAAFLTFPDARLEAFYWIQYYKFASTARPGCPPVDLQGVWPTWDTPWTAIWANLNLQLTYSWQTKANVGFLAQPLWDALWTNRNNLRRNVTDIPQQRTWTDAACLGRSCSYDFHSPLDPALAERNQYEAGNLIWLLFYYWQHCRGYGDAKQLGNRFYPLLKAATSLFLHLRTERNGRYGLPPTASPEYGNRSVGPNSNYDLASLRWGLRTLLETDSLLGLHDPQRAVWADFERRLVPYPYDDATGFRVSETTAFRDTTHRHYSHLFMIYPYRSVNWEQPAERPRIALSVGRWKGNQGYSRTGKAAMLLGMGDGDGAWREMEIFLDRFIKPNTLYAETGPVIETPLAAMCTVHDFYLQDWGGRIRVFPALPAHWTDAAFARMRADGAFLVSATRRGGRTVLVEVESEKGGTCRLATDIPAAECRVTDRHGRPLAFRTEGAAGNVIAVETQPGTVFRVTRAGAAAAEPAPLPHGPREAHPYGVRRSHRAR